MSKEKKKLATVIGDRLGIKAITDGKHAIQVAGVDLTHQEARALVIQIIRVSDYGTYAAKRKASKNKCAEMENEL